MKKRYIIILFVIGLLALSFVPFIQPVRPFIQLPGEIWPGSQNWPVIGTLLGGMTNTFASTLKADDGAVGEVRRHDVLIDPRRAEPDAEE